MNQGFGVGFLVEKIMAEFMTLTSSIINGLIVYGICQAFFITIILLRSGNKTLFKKLFAVLLAVEGIILFERLLFETELIKSAPHLLGIAYPISFLKPPLMLFMALAATVKDFRLTLKMGWHFIPFVLILIMNLPFFGLSGAEKLESVQQFMDKIPSYQSFSFYFALSFFVYIGIYIFKSLKTLNTFRVQVVNNELVNWYRLVLMSYSVFLILHLAYFLIQPIGQFNFALVNQVSMLAMTFIIQSIAFKLIDQSTLFTTKTPKLENIEQRNIHEDQIIQKLEKDKIYLDHDLTLEHFAKAVYLSPSYVSELINQKFGYSFKTLIKVYRLSEAKSLLENANGGKVKLIDIAYQAGFSNKVSFYRAFKEFEHVSPTEYLQNLKKQEKQ
ncbi:MAG: helix-turn-helix domain-containing protein [Bacteroidota bacterium]